MRRPGALVTTSLFALLLVGAVCARPAAQGAASATASPATPAPGRPLLWRVEGRTPLYLFGTIHVPDERVLALRPAVERAFADAQVVYTEIPMDAGTQVGAMKQVLLPGEQRLSEVIGAELAARLGRAVQQALPESAPAGTAAMLALMLDRMKPWAAMSQLTLLEFLPDLQAGRQPLDAMLWKKAEEGGKKTAALETVDEQLAVFDSFTLAEQTRMLALTLDELEKAPKGARSQAQQLIDAYLSGDVSRLTDALNEAMAGDRALMQRFVTVAIDQRNRTMTDRILKLRREQPGSIAFVAVGAAHYAGPTGIVALLEQAGEKVTRIE